MAFEAAALEHSADGRTELKELRERLKATHLAPGVAGSWNWDIKNDRLHLDSRMAAIYGVDADAAESGLPTTVFFEAIHASDADRIKIAVAGILNGAEVFSKSYRIAAANQPMRWVEGHGRCYFDQAERPECFSGILVDVTARRRVEDRLRVAQSAGGVGTFEHVPGYATAEVSEQFCRLLGLNGASVLPVQTINRLVRPGNVPMLQMGPGVADELPYAEIAIRRADTGEERWLARRAEVVRDVEGGELRYLGVIYDITDSKRTEDALRQLNETLEQRVASEIAERLQMEEALRQAQKMEAIGQLTGGIAHDFNNLLTVILGNVDMAVRRLGNSGDERMERALTSAHKGAERAAALTQRLLAFARRQPLAPKKIGVARVFRGMADLLSRSLGETVVLKMVTPADLWTVEVDPNQLENAILNLAVNARDAMGGSGTLTLEAANVARGSTLTAGGVAAQDYLMLSVTDTGAGMSDETIEHAFEPFFTTKDVGKGTGLGLSMVYGFVKQSGGDISISSKAGRGTTIYLYLPKATVDEPTQPELGLDTAEQRNLDETILVVEDDDDVRQFAVDCLNELGYTVFEAGGGAAGLALLREQAKVIDLLVTDVVMPDVPGRQLSEAARKLKPTLPVLYISGYPRDVILHDGRVDAGVELLSKPFTQQALAARVRELLDRSELTQVRVGAGELLA